jgi:PelA/Pel-15E family pectate lyase
MKTILTCAATFGLLNGSAEAAEPLSSRAHSALDKAAAFMRSLSTEGGYLWRYSEDLQERWGENKATLSQIWIQPPGTPSMGQAFLRIYEVTKGPHFFDAAQAAATALARGQLESGGWDYLVDFDPAKGQQWYRRADKERIPLDEAAGRRNTSTFDDDNTQSALQFLMAFIKAAPTMHTAEGRQIRESLEYGLAKLLEAQYPNGAWPQRYNGKPRDLSKFPVRRATIPEQYPREHPKSDYAGFYTLNDHTQRDCIRTMLDAFKHFGDRKYLEAALRGGDFLIAAQLPSPQSAWAQQYNFAMEPAWARAFEPPAVCTGESAGAIRTLIEIYLETGEEKLLKPIPAVIDWFQRSRLGPNTWARFYELGTGQPIYGDRDGKIHYRLDEISEERRRGYAWQGNFNIPATIAYFEEVQKAGRPAYLARRAPKPRPTEAQRASLEKQAGQVIDALDERGRWIANGRVETRVFIRNVQTLCDYLESLRP